MPKHPQLKNPEDLRGTERRKPPKFYITVMLEVELQEGQRTKLVYHEARLTPEDVSATVQRLVGKIEWG